MNKKNENLLIIVFALIVTLAFLFPAFLGKVDVACDIRNYLNYPWKYHYIDKNIIKSEVLLPKQDQDLEVPPKDQKQILVKFNYNELSNIKIDKKFNYYLYFDCLKGNSDVKFAIYLLDRYKSIVNFPFIVLPIENSNNLQVRGKVNLNLVLDILGSFSGLKDYDFIILVQNDSNLSAHLKLLNYKLSIEDLSGVNSSGIHNPFIEDSTIWFAPAREYFSNAIKKGKIPFWNSFILSGTEFIAEPQLGFFNPIYFLVYRIFDHFTAHSVVLFISLFLCFLGSYKLARHWGCDIYGALLTSLVYAFNPFMISWIGFEHSVMIFSLLPFLFLSFDLAIENSRFINLHLIVAVFLLGLIVVSGHLQIVYYSIILFLLYFIYKVILGNYKNKLFLSFFSVLIFGLALGSVVLIPSFHLISNAHRLPLLPDDIKSNSFQFDFLFSFLNPMFKGDISWISTDRFSNDISFVQYKNNFFKNYIYFGFLPFFISLFTLIKVLKKPIILFLYIVILFSFLCAGNGDFYLLIRDIIPGFKTLQNIRFLQMYSFCVPFLAGFGLTAFFSLFKKLSNNKKTILTIIILTISTFDLLHYSSFFLSWTDKANYKPIYKNSSLEYLTSLKATEKEPFRVLSIENPNNIVFLQRLTSIKPNNLWMYGIEIINGYASFLPKDLFWTFVFAERKDKERLYSDKPFAFSNNINIIYPLIEYKSKIYDLLNVKYFVTSSDLALDEDQAVKVFDGDSRIWLNKNYFPRAFLASSYKIIPNKKDAIAYLDSDVFNPNAEVILQDASSLLSHKPQDSMEALYIIHFDRYESENIDLTVETNQPAFLVLGNNLNDNWKVKINGKEEKLLKANVVQSSVFLPKAGHYKVQFYYCSRYFNAGLFITGIALILLFGLYFYTFFRKVSCK